MYVYAKRTKKKCAETKSKTKMTVVVLLFLFLSFCFRLFVDIFTLLIDALLPIGFSTFAVQLFCMHFFRADSSVHIAVKLLKFSDGSFPLQFIISQNDCG